MRKSTLLVGVGLGLMAAPAVAQTSRDASTPTALGEVVVTATKRASNLQDVPVAVTALTSEAIQNQRIGEFSDLTRAAASLTITESTASPNNAIILRGIGTYAVSIGVEPSVAVIVDDVPVVQQAQAFDNLSDVERIEVLRGPQGTLFGKNASAGVINIATKDPAKTFEVAVDGTTTTDSDHKGELSVSGPINDAVGFRLSGYYDNYAGNVRNLYDGHLLNDQESYGLHGKLRIQATPQLNIVLSGAYSSEHSNGTAAPIRSIDLDYIPAGATTPVTPKFAGVPILPALAGITPGAGNYAVRYDNDSPTDNTQATFSGKATYDIGFADLIAVTSYQDWKYDFSADLDGTDLNVVGAAKPVTHPVGPATGANQSGPYHATELTQELRLASKGGGPLSYVIGAFYADAATHRSFTRGPVFAPADWQGYEGSRSLAAFAGVDYKLPTKTTLSGGLRVNNERIEDSFVNLLPNATVYAPASGSTPAQLGTCGAGSAFCAGHNTDTVVTWKASVSQQLAPRVSAYASVATGYKGYAYDISSNYTPVRTANPARPEHSISYEVGLKSRLFHNRAQVNIAAFLTDYNNFQANSGEYINGALQTKLNNVGRLRTQGVELEMQGRPTQWLRFDGSFAYTDATILSFPNASCYPGQAATGTGCGPSTNPVGLGNVQDRSNEPLPNSPKWKFNVGSTIDHDLGYDVRGSININYQFQSKVNFDLLGDPQVTQGAYGVLNGSASVERGRYKITVFGNNLFDQHYATNLADGFGTYGVHLVTEILSRDSQRYFGVKVAAKF